jgi:hypothetical protein
MPIDFKCSSCSHLIRVPDGTEGKKTMCPKCSVSQQIPGGSEPDEPETPRMGEHDFSDQSNAGSTAGGGGFAPDPTNPYASPETGYQPPDSPSHPGQINPQQADLGSIINYSIECWKEHLGILVGAFLVIVGVNVLIWLVQQGLIAAAGQVWPFAVMGIAFSVSLISNAIQVYLGIGIALITLKIGRKESAKFSDLFEGGKQFLPIFGFTLGVGILTIGLAFGVGILAAMLGDPQIAMPVVLGLMALIGIASLLFTLFFWPFYYLVVDEKATLFESFAKAKEIAVVNIGNTILLGLLSMGIALLGYMACCIGLLFALPLVSMLWTTAYLQMTGQIQTR